MPNAILFYRIAHWFYTHHVPLIPAVFQGLIFLIYNCKIPYRNQIGRNTYLICKGIGVSIVDGTKIGDRCKLGINSMYVGKGPYKNLPQIGNDVWVGPGAVIVGPVIVGNNVIIAPNSVVTKSVPNGAIVGGVPAKLLGWTKDLEYDIMKNESYDENFMPYMFEARHN